MKRYIIYSLAGLMFAGITSCSKENPFGPDEPDRQGRLLKSALSLELQNADGYPALLGTRAATPAAEQFTIDFIKEGEDSPVISYLYSEMPEVVTLPVGAYTAVGRYGDNKESAWEEPYFRGETKFIIAADRITDDVKPIVAVLSNVRVSITFDPALKANMGDDSKVTVKVGESGSLEFTANDSERSGYFAYVENSCSLTATFSGDVEGYPVTESKVYDTVAPGSHYSITFRLHDAGAGDPGSISAGLTVDASVEIVDMNVTMDEEDDSIIEDDLRPVEGEPTTPVDPTKPDKKHPSASALEPQGDYAGYTPLDLNKVNEVTDNLYCAWKVISEAEGGFKKFEVKIISDTLTPEELEGVGLAEDIDLINPGDFEEPLVGLGFPVRLAGKNEASFDITSFLNLMTVLGQANHEFRLTVEDANGESVISVKLHTN